MAFSGSLNQNEIYSAIYNMIISQTVNGKLIGGMYDKLTDLFRVDGSEYGDTKLFYDVQLGKVESWSNDSEASNLLSTQRPAAPNCQAITINQFRKIWLTVDNFMSKRAFGDEGVFGQFNSVIMGTMRDTQRVYFTKLMNVAIGTTVAGATKGTSQQKTVTLSTAPATDTNEDKIARNKLDAGIIAKAIDDIMSELQDVSKDYNDLGYERSYDPADFIIVWNQDFASKITKQELPLIYNESGLKPDLSFVLPAKYFGTVSNATTSAANARAMDEMDAAVGGGAAVHYRPGDTVATGATVTANTTYANDAKVICKIVHKDAFKVMSGFEANTEFTNSRALLQNNYLIFGFSKPQNSRLEAYPVITLKQS